MARSVWPTLEIPTKHAPFGGTTGEWDISVLGVDWSGASFVLSIAAQEGDAALFTLTNAAEGSQGVSASYDPDVVDPESGVSIGATSIRPQVDETTLEGLTWGSTATNEPLNLWWDLLATPSGQPQRSVCCGPIKLYPGIAD